MGLCIRRIPFALASLRAFGCKASPENTKKNDQTIIEETESDRNRHSERDTATVTDSVMETDRQTHLQTD